MNREGILVERFYRNVSNDPSEKPLQAEAILYLIFYEI